MNILTPPVTSLPDVLYMGESNKPRLSQITTLDNIKFLLTHMGFIAEYNVVADRIRFSSNTVNIPDTEDSQDQIVTLIEDMALRVDMKSITRIGELLVSIAKLSPYHPMMEAYDNIVWDKVDRIAQLEASVTTSTPLWGVYLRKWLKQVIEAITNWTRDDRSSISHVLVFTGDQGKGKTRWFSKLGGPWLKTEAELMLSSSAGKDHQIEVLKYAMAELAELDGIFRKTDIAHMKAFISRTSDSIRVPYAKRATKKARMTAFCASVNECAFLTDATGSRRYWPVEVDEIDWSLDIDTEQLWAQVIAEWSIDSSYELTTEEEKMRAIDSEDKHTFISSEVEKVSEYLTVHANNEKFPLQAMNRTEIAEMIFGRGKSFSNVQIAHIGQCIAKKVGKHKTISGKQRSWLVPYNELAFDTKFWPSPGLRIIK